MRFKWNFRAVCGLSVLMLAGGAVCECFPAMQVYGAGETSAVATENEMSFQYEPIPEEYRTPAENPGQIQRVDYTYQNENKSAYVYVPCGYDPETPYDVFYLMHGGGGNAAAYLGTEENPSGLSMAIDHLIEDGAMEPVLVVAPSFYPSEEADKSAENAGLLVEQFPEELQEALIPAVENRYHTYAETTDMAGLTESREHRAFGGFSMGAVTTWYVFEKCMDTFATFVPVSGDSWAITELGGSSEPEATAEHLAESFRKSGYESSDFCIVSVTGTKDIAYEMLENQMNAMREQEEVFTFGDTLEEGNVHYYTVEGKEHTYGTACEYFCNILKLLY